MSDERFAKGELFVYVNGDRWELGMVKRPNGTGDGYFCWYSNGDTAANTPTRCMHKLANHGHTKVEGLLRTATSGLTGKLTEKDSDECHVAETERFECLDSRYKSFDYNPYITVHVMECSACGRTYEHVNGDYEYCPHCGRHIKEVDE